MPILEIMMTNNDSDVIEYYRKLEEQTNDKQNTDSGIDLIAPKELIVPARSLGTINFEIKCQMKTDSLHENIYLPYYLYPRSSISKTPLIMANSVGIIDSEYRGNIMAKVRNLEDEDYIIKKGTRLFQICLPNLSPITVGLVDNLSSTVRGEGGFGSTGATY